MTETDQFNLDEITYRIRATLVGQFGAEIAGVPDDASLPEALGDRYDSLAALECVNRVEQAFGIEVDFVAHDVRYWFASITRIAQFTAERLEDRAVIGGRG